MRLKIKTKKFLMCVLTLSVIFICANAKNAYAMDCEEYTPSDSAYGQECFTGDNIYLEPLVENVITLPVYYDEEMPFRVLPPAGLSGEQLKRFYVNDFLVKKEKYKSITIKKYTSDNGLSWHTFKRWLYECKDEDSYLPPKTKKLRSKDKVKKAFVERYIFQKSKDESMSVQRYVKENGLAKQTFYAWLFDYRKKFDVEIFHRKLWTPEEKQQYVNEYLKANSDGKTMSVKSYAEKNNLNEKTFYMWLNSYKKGSNMNTHKHKMRTIEEKQWYVYKYIQANSNGRFMSVNAFAKAHNLKYSTLYTWIKNYLGESSIIF